MAPVWGSASASAVGVGTARRPITIVTREPVFSCVPPAGSCSITMPSSEGTSVSRRRMRTLKPASRSAELARPR